MYYSNLGVKEALTDQLEHLTVRCVVGSGVSNVDKCGRLSQPSWLLGAL